mmetsp:Transcript_21587/g.45558  ORF Transcript_21587/g.45558 Transcript_21587/m.45558 type:complete len:230 (-) Transcript_21587:794-1483(-)
MSPDWNCNFIPCFHEWSVRPASKTNQIAWIPSREMLFSIPRQTLWFFVVSQKQHWFRESLFCLLLLLLLHHGVGGDDSWCSSSRCPVRGNVGMATKGTNVALRQPSLEAILVEDVPARDISDHVAFSDFPQANRTEGIGCVFAADTAARIDVDRHRVGFDAVARVAAFLVHEPITRAGVGSVRWWGIGVGTAFVGAPDPFVRVGCGGGFLFSIQAGFASSFRRRKSPGL